MVPLLALLAFVCSSPALGASGTVRLALLEETPANVTFTLARPLEQLVESSSSTILDVETLPCYTSAGDLRFRLRPQADSLEEVSFSTGPAALLESDSELVLVWPPDPLLLEELRRRAAEPASYRGLWTVDLSSRAVTVSLARGAQGETLVSLLSEEGVESARWQSTVLNHYRLAWRGGEVSVALVGKVHGGLDRLAAALARERVKGRVIGVSRGGVFDGELEALRGAKLAEALDGLGLDYAAAGARVLRRWRDLQAFGEKRPGAVTFLSANVVYSTDPARSFFPDHAVLEHDGLKIAFTAVTNPASARYLGTAGLQGVRIADPVESLEARLPAYREKVDLVVLLAGVADDERLRRLRGVDVVLSEDLEAPDGADRASEATLVERARRPYDRPALVARACDTCLNLVEASVARGEGGRDLTLTERRVSLAPGAPSDPDYPGFDPDSFGIVFATGAPLIPAFRALYAGERPPSGVPRLGPHEFWRLAASLSAEELQAEAALLPVSALGVSVDGAVTEPVARHWLRTEDTAIVADLPGARLRELLRLEKEQHEREKAGLPTGGPVHFVAGGVGEGGRIHGLPIEPGLPYRVVYTRVVADALGLPPEKTAGRLDELVLAGLRRQRGSPPALYRAWAEGRPREDGGLWTIHFRDFGVNIRNTKVVRDDAFSGVSNSRIQGLDERLVGLVGKLDADYLKGPYKWSSTAEAEYARSTIQPRDGPAVTNTAADRLLLRTAGTRRAGSIGMDWLARSWGPTVGVQFDGEFEAEPGLKRKQVYSAFPGVEFYGGSVVRTLEVAANFRRDLSVEPPRTNYGLRLRSLAALPVGPKKGATLEGDVFANYFFRTPTDGPNDVAVEANAVARLRVPVWRHLSVAPFVDFYVLRLKTRPVWAYSAMTGITISFSRLWRPQYERF